MLRLVDITIACSHHAYFLNRSIYSETVLPFKDYDMMTI